MVKDDFAQTTMDQQPSVAANKSVQTAEVASKHCEIVRLQDSNTQTKRLVPAVDASTQSSKMVEKAIGDGGEQTSLAMESTPTAALRALTITPRRTEVLFDRERLMAQPPAGLPSDHFAKGEEHLPQILSYGWANENPFVPALDHKTFNVTINPPSEV